MGQGSHEVANAVGNRHGLGGVLLSRDGAVGARTGSGGGAPPPPRPGGGGGGRGPPPPPPPGGAGGWGGARAGG
ncbi:MAG: hypothetical protein F4217_13015, partial [Acidimicrobiaceae bacterium]|nr:hypothetical protein [Acidimicrobiaceae bacterium]